MAIVVALVLVLLGSLASYLSAFTTQRQHTQEYNDFKQQQLALTTEHINQKIADYEQILLAAASVSNVKGGQGLTRADWQTFYHSSQVQARAPKTLAIGYVQHVNADALPDYIAQRQAEGFADFSITPSGERASYSPITFIEPFDVVNQLAFGFDMQTDPARSAAMAAARNSGTFALTSSVVLRQDMDKSNPPKSALLYYPLYEGPHDLLADRQANITGYVYMAFRLADIMSVRAEALQKVGAGYVLTDITVKPQLMVQSTTPRSGKTGDAVQKDLQVVDRRWQLQQFSTPSQQGWITPSALFISGCLISVLLGGFVYLLIDRRLTYLRHLHDAEIQDTRNELLALASHQLRTPASGVKQYLGMLQAGYFGDLEPEQHSVITKAATANDRQLEIIDQLLYVAKADAGQLNLQQTEFDFAAVIKNATVNLTAAAKAKQLNIKLQGRKQLPLVGDERLLAMVAENLISNAIKYSYPNGSVWIKLQGRSDHVELTVRDEGVGIAPEDHGKLFQKFSRIHNDLSVSEGGSGLGLYLARVLTEAHGGTLEVASSGDKGALFTLRLPKTSAKEQNVAQLTD